MFTFLMVYFTCDLCGEALKKKQVPQHQFRCDSSNFSCIDCQKVFDRDTFNSHLKCISENQKYGGSSYVAKPNKGEIKQDLWIQNVRAAIKNVINPRLKQILHEIQVHSNIPRKEAKFVNFLQNSLRIRDINLCKEAWNAIKVETEIPILSAESTTLNNGEQTEICDDIPKNSRINLNGN